MAGRHRVVASRNARSCLRWCWTEARSRPSVFPRPPPSPPRASPPTPLAPPPPPSTPPPHHTPHTHTLSHYHGHHHHTHHHHRHLHTLQPPRESPCRACGWRSPRHGLTTSPTLTTSAPTPTGTGACSLVGAVWEPPGKTPASRGWARPEPPAAQTASAGSGSTLQTMALMVLPCFFVMLKPGLVSNALPGSTCTAHPHPPPPGRSFDILVQGMDVRCRSGRSVEPAAWHGMPWLSAHVLSEGRS